MIDRLSLIAAALFAAQSTAAVPPFADGATVSLEQISFAFAPGATEAAKTAKVKLLTEAAADIASCADGAAVAKRIGAELLSRDGVPMASLPPQLQTILAVLPVGKATPLFGQKNDYVRVLVLCERRSG